MDTSHRFARAKDVPLTPAEISAATAVLAAGPICIATVQRRLSIGWNRAADLVGHIKGTDALPAVAQHLVDAPGQGNRTSNAAAHQNSLPRGEARTLDEAWDFFSIIAGAVHTFNERHPIAPDERLFLGNLIRDVAWKYRELPATSSASRAAFEHWYAREHAYSPTDSQLAFTLVTDGTDYQDSVVGKSWKVWQAARVGPR